MESGSSKFDVYDTTEVEYNFFFSSKEKVLVSTEIVALNILTPHMCYVQKYNLPLVAISMKNTGLFIHQPIPQASNL